MQTEPTESSGYFHVVIQDGEKSKQVHNLSADAVLQRVAVPYRLGERFRFDGFEFQPARVKRLRIQRTTEPMDLEKVDTSSLGTMLAGVFSLGMRMTNGDDVTDDILLRADQVIAERGGVPARAPGPFDDQVRADRLFVAMSFDAHLNQCFEAIKQACDNFKIRAVRVDQEMSSGSIIDRIQAHLRDSAFVVADLTQAKPNVYYEIGYFDAVCRARGEDPANRLLLVAQSVEADAHFDLKHRGIQQYDNPFTLMKRVEAWLREREQIVR